VLFVAAALAASVTFERPRAREETQADEVVPNAASAAVMRGVADRNLRRAALRSAYRAADRAVAWQSPVVEACLARTAAAGGEVALSLRLASAGKPSRATVKEEKLTPLGACVAEAFEGAVFPTFGPRSGLRVAYTVRATPPAEAAAVPPTIDRFTGLADLPFGSKPTDAADLKVSTYDEDTTWYTRDSDRYCALLGVTASGVYYGFHRDAGMYMAAWRTYGENANFALFTALKAVYGKPRWDGELKSYYWRGEHVLITTRKGGVDGQMVLFIDLDRLAASGQSGRLPGDKVDAARADIRIPHILQ
jgi:hypothetical protein